METAVKRGSVVITVTIKRKYKMPTEKTCRDKTEIMYCTTQSKNYRKFKEQVGKPLWTN